MGLNNLKVNCNYWKDLNSRVDNSFYHAQHTTLNLGRVCLTIGFYKRPRCHSSLY